MDSTTTKDATEIVPKVRRTYGRKKDADGVQLSRVDTSSSGTTTSFTRLRAYGVTPDENVENDEDVSCQPSSRLLDASEDVFGWRKKLAEIDNAFDEEDDAPLPKPARLFSPQGLLSSQPKGSETGQRRGVEDSEFNCPQSSMGATSSTLTPDSPTPSSSKPKRAARTSADDFSDNVSPAKPANQRDSSPTSPVISFVISTPKGRSSPTPPTSDLEPDVRPPENTEVKMKVLSDGEGHDGSDVKMMSSASKKGKGREKAKGVKKLNKKELDEAKKTHARIMADQEVVIEKKSEPLKLSTFLERVQHAAKPLLKPSHPASSDPIQPFTSSPRTSEKKTSPNQVQSSAGQPTRDSDGEPAARGTVLAEKSDKGSVNNKERARQLKRQLLARRTKAVEQDSNDEGDEDDDLEIVEASPKTYRLLTRAGATTATKKNTLSLAKIPVNRRRTAHAQEVHSDEEDELLRAAAKPSFAGKARHSTNTMDHMELQRVLLHKTSKQNKELTKAKENEWVRRGGRLKYMAREEASMEADPSLNVAVLAQRLLEKQREPRPSENENEENNPHLDEDEDGSDREYQPIDRGSASPRGSDYERPGEGHSGESDNESMKEQVDGTDGEDDKPFPGRRGRRHRQVLRTVLDDSDEENIPPSRVLVPETSMIVDDDDENVRIQVLAHRGSRSSLEDNTPDEEDKENDTRLMFDRGEDKENNAVPRHLPVGLLSRPTIGSSRGSGIFELTEGVRTNLSMSPNSVNMEDSSRTIRRPLQSRTRETSEDPFSVTPLNSPPMLRKQGGSIKGSPMALQSAFARNRSVNFSDLFEEDSGPLLSAIGEEGTPIKSGLLAPPEINVEPKPLSLGGMGDLFSQEDTGGFSRMKRPGPLGDLSLTQDVGLQPALEVSTQVKRRAEVIFDKEQELLVEEANSRSAKDPDLYVNENGLLTQTKPDGSSPAIYRAWPQTADQGATQSQAVQPPPTTQRLPLSTLSFTGELPESPTQKPGLSRLSRLRRRSLSSDFGDVVGIPSRKRSVSPSPLPKPNAFSVLLENAQKAKRRQKLEKSEFVEGEAVESDDDEMFGFGPRRKQDDEESDNDDPEAVVENLVDDAQIDVDALAEDKVLEKHREHLEQEDVELERIAQAAAQGKLRGKRRSGLALDDSEDEEEDEEARRIRRRMHKKRRVDGDTLDALAKDERTRPYYDAYQRDVQDDDNEDFRHLDGDDMDMNDVDDFLLPTGTSRSRRVPF